MIWIFNVSRVIILEIIGTKHASKTTKSNIPDEKYPVLGAEQAYFFHAARLQQKGIRYFKERLYAYKKAEPCALW
jgi:hypothetical protein